jgi:anaerobic magnesium-protoporphyrin IX monomethyl ester cyclase
MLVHPWNYHDEGVQYTPQQLEYIWRNPPLGIVQLATETRKAGHEVRICDLERDLVVNDGNLEVTLSQMHDMIERLKPDCIGITMLSVRYLEARRIISLCEEIRQAAGLLFKIVAGNIHPTCEPEITLRDNPSLDAIFIGEADEPFKAFVNGIPVSQIPGIAMRENSRIIVKPQWMFPELDELPFPDWNFIDTEFYASPNFASHGRKNEPARSLDIITSRGCVYHCSFCVYNKAKYRSNSPEYVVSNIEYMLDNFDIDSIFFLDSSIGNNKRQLMGICETIVSRGLQHRFYWSANMRSNQVDEDLLRRMWEAGCRKLLYGFESGSQRILDAMKKRCTVEQNEMAARLHRKLGFPYLASMIAGFPGETEKDLEMTIKWLNQVRPPLLGVNTYVPLPGSEDYIRLKAGGEIVVQDPETWRLLGEVNNRNSPVFADVPMKLFWQYVDRMQLLGMEFQKEAADSTDWRQL